MMRSHAPLAWAVLLVWIAACVNVDKPGQSRQVRAARTVAARWRTGRGCQKSEVLPTQDADENGDSRSRWRHRCAGFSWLGGRNVGMAHVDRALDVPLAVCPGMQAQEVARDATGRSTSRSLLGR